MRYKAFLSYAHADGAAANKLHRKLERFRIDPAFMGRVTNVGPIPSTLRPVFRDRHDFTAGEQLAAATVEALDQSAALLVVCSSVAATRPAVNEEVRLFKWRHPDRPIIPIIIEGSPPTCFPLALRYEVDRDGHVSDRPITVLAPDTRQSGDGLDLAISKVVARLLGVPPDEVYRRAERDRRRADRIRVLLGTVALSITLAGGFFAWQSHEKQRTLAEIETLVSRYTSISTVRAGEGNARDLKDAITAIAQGSATDDRLKRAMQHLKAGKPELAEPLLQSVAEDKEARVAKDRHDASAAYRHLGAIAGLGDPSRALIAYEKALNLETDDSESLYWTGYLSAILGDNRTSEIALRRLLDVSRARSDERGIFRALLRLGDLSMAAGQHAQALDRYQDALALAQGNDTKSDGAVDMEWARDHSGAVEKIGDVLMAQGGAEAALARYQSSLNDRLRRVEKNKSDAILQRDLAVGFEKVGLAQMTLMSHQEAISAFEAAVTIRKKLIEREPQNTWWLRDLSVGYEKIGDVQKAGGSGVDALSSYRRSLEIRRSLVEKDGANAAWKRDLSFSHNKIGDMHRLEGALDEALNDFRAGLAIRLQLLSEDAQSRERQVDAALSHVRIAEVLKVRSEKALALDSYRSARVLLLTATANSDHRVWKTHLKNIEADIASIEK